MIRTFSQHVKRECVLLDGHWDFAVDSKNLGIQEQWFKQFPEQHRKIYVPGCWNNEMGLYDYEGVAWYQTSFTIRTYGHAKLIFHAISGYADIYVDGVHVGEHYGGFTAFEVILPELAAGEHTLVVRTDNTHNEQTIPLAHVDWYHYGGILRPVELQLLPDLYIDKVIIKYALNGNDACVDISAGLRRLAGASENIPVTITLNNEIMHMNEETWPKEQEYLEVQLQQRWENLSLWELENPALYTVRVIAGDDDYADRVGFRTVEVQNKQILLNGKPLYIQGVNRHEEHPEWGFAFPPKLMDKDLDIIEELGCNSIRGSHYPQSPYWLDLLDERGIVFWSEIPLWQYHVPHMTDPLVRKRAMHMLEEMISHNSHHPSILFWSVHNECDTNTAEGVEFTKLLVNRVRELDDSRLVTYATHHALDDQTLAMFDVIGINKYYGWYGGEVEEFEPFMKDYHAYAESVGAGHIPVILAEFGGAGVFGDTGWEERRLFSEDYQADILNKALRIFREDSNIVGTYIWQFADIRSDARTFRDRARSFNNKGLVNEYRKPKLAYREVRRIYRQGMPESR
jgi:Beta-galactosidase/beta-glucuronidase